VHTWTDGVQEPCQERGGLRLGMQCLDCERRQQCLGALLSIASILDRRGHIYHGLNSVAEFVCHLDKHCDCQMLDQSWIGVTEIIQRRSELSWS
jgi:hypothetical protein